MGISNSVFLTSVEGQRYFMPSAGGLPTSSSHDNEKDDRYMTTNQSNKRRVFCDENQRQTMSCHIII